MMISLSNASVIPLFCNNIYMNSSSLLPVFFLPLSYACLLFQSSLSNLCMGLSLLAFLPPWKTLSLMHREDRWIWERLRVLMSCGGSERAGSGVVGRGRAGQGRQGIGDLAFTGLSRRVGF
jgi:hypothetical protein